MRAWPAATLRRVPRSAAIAIAASLALAACGSTSAPGGTATASQTPAPDTAVVELEKGRSFTIQLRPDKAPKTVANFLAKARSGAYDGTTFHRVVAGFVAQGGDPLSKTDPARAGTGGGKQDTELSDLPFTKGAVGVARGAYIKVSNDAQFFVCLEDAPHLNGAYTNFGTVTAGMEVVHGIKVGDKIKTVRVP